MSDSNEQHEEFKTPGKSHYDSAQQAIAAALQSADAIGVEKRHILTGLWQTAIGTLLAAGDLPTLVEFLEDRMAHHRGHGHNADAEPTKLSGAEMSARREQSTRLAELVSGHLEPLMASFDQDGIDGISVTVDMILTILADRWGPVHLRRILGQQSSAFRSGDTAIIMPQEPSAPNRQKVTTTVRLVDRPAEAPLPAPPANSDTIVPPTRRSVRPAQRVDIHVRTDVVGTTGVYGIALQMSESSSDRREIREIEGVLHNDPNGRRTLLAACIDVLSTLPVTTDEIVLSSTAQFLVEDMSIAQLTGVHRLESEADLWDQLDSETQGRSVTWQITGPGIGSPLAQRSDRVLRERVESESAQRKAS